jgi:tRNA(fMet)-specific endonuclease VapC
MYFLDTNACIRLINGTSERLVDRIRRHDVSEILLCSVVKSELVYGAFRSSRLEANLKRLREFFAPFSSVPFDDRSAEHCGRIRSELSRAGTPIGALDTMIAAIARTYDLILVTHNVREFSRVVGLRLEDWEAA